MKLSQFHGMSYSHFLVTWIYIEYLKKDWTKLDLQFNTKMFIEYKQI